MNIKRVPFTSLQLGDTFLFAGGIYMKTMTPAYEYAAVSLTSGSSVTLDPDTTVIPIDVTLSIGGKA